MDKTFLRNRATYPDKLTMLGAASKLEESAKQIGKQARTIREFLNQFPASEMLNTTHTRESEVTDALAAIHTHLQGLDTLFNRLVGEPK